MAKIFHVLTQEHQNQFLQNKIYRPPSLEQDGFIHFSKADQISSVIKNFYQAFDRLILWRIHETKLKEKLVYEPPLEAPSSGILFPHYYQELDYQMVEKTFHLTKTAGEFKLPKDLLD